jgi:small subunit ribosomal protein S12
MSTLNQLSFIKPRKNRKNYTRSGRLRKCPQLKAVCLRVYTTTPKKPNSAIRKVAKVKLSNRTNTLVYIPGQGHNLQQHSVVLVRGGKVPDLPGVLYRTIRGKYDFLAKETFERKTNRSKYGIKNSKNLN